MTPVGLVLRNLWSRKLRSFFTGVAVAVGVMTVVTLAVVTHSLTETAGAVLRAGTSDFTVAQKGVSDVLYSSISDDQVKRIASEPGVNHVVGVLLSTDKYDANHPLLIEIGVPPDQLENFGVKVLRGAPFAADSPNEMMIGWRLAQDLNKNVGDEFVIGSDHFTITGIYSTGQPAGDGAVMFPLAPFQAWVREPGTVTLVFVTAHDESDVPALRARIEHDEPTLTTIRTEAEFGRADRNLVLISAAERGATILAVVIGAVIVMNTMLLSFFERTRDFGIMRAVGWRPLWIVALVLGEALVISVIGAAIGVGLSYLAVSVLERVSDLRGLLHAEFGPEAFWRALYTAAAVALIGALYPAVRAGRLSPIEALRHE